MGIENLNKFLKVNAPNCQTTLALSRFRGTRVAIDANNLLCSKMYTANKGTCDLQQLKIDPFASIDRSEADKEWYRQLLYTVLTYTSYGITPIFVFDGKHLPAKAKTQNKRKQDRKENQRRAEELAQTIAKKSLLERTDEEIEKLGNAKSSSAVFITSEQMCTFKSILNMVGVPVITAKGDGEDLCVALAHAGKVSAVVSKDTDCFVLGCPITISGISKGSRSPNQTVDVTIYSKILEGLNIDRSTFIDLCILGKCDYNNGVPKIMLPTAFKLFKDHGCIENIMKYESYKYDFYGEDGMNVNLDFCRNTIFCIKSVEDCLDESHEGKLPNLDISKFALSHPQTRNYLRSLNIEDFMVRLTASYDNIKSCGDYGAEYVLGAGRLVPNNQHQLHYDVFILPDKQEKRETLELRDTDSITSGIETVNIVSDLVVRFD